MDEWFLLNDDCRLSYSWLVTHLRDGFGACAKALHDRTTVAHATMTTAFFAAVLLLGAFL
jgi:hypothetical protein